MDTKSCREELKESTGKKDISLPISRAEKLSNNNGGDSKIIIGDDDADDSSRRDTELWIAGRQASRGGWVRISDGTERVFYHHNILGHSPKITLERPPTFGQDDPTWADAGTALFMYRGTCSRCKDVVLRNEPGPVALSAFQGQVALSFLLCRPCLNWLIESARSELKGEQPLPISAEETVEGPNCGGVGGVGSSSEDTVFSCRPTRVVKVYADASLAGAGDLLARSQLPRSFPKCMYSRLSEQTLRPNRSSEQRADCVKAKVAAVEAGEERRRTARATQMKLRCISQHGSQGTGQYLCWVSPEGRIDYFGEMRGGKAHGWGLAEYEDGSWCLSSFSQGKQNTPEGGRLSTLQYANGIRYYGEMKEGKPHGKGTKTWPDESRYTGDSFCSKKHGNGIKTFPDGSEHTGQFRSGVRNGPGIYIDARGRKTTGRFCDNPFSGNEQDNIVAPAKTDITIELGQNNPETLLDLAVASLAVVADTQPALNKASLLMSKMPLHLHPVVAAAFATRARGLSPGFRASLPSLAWRRIPEIRLCNASLLTVDIAKLCYFLEAIPNLKKLVLIGCKLSEETIGPVADIMATSQKLEEVDLSWNPIRREGARAVITALETAPRLRRLGLAGCRLGADGGQLVISAIGAGREHFRLLDLDLAFNTLGTGSGEALATALRRNETLTRLSVRANGLGPEGGLRLAAGIARNCGTLRELVVTDNRFGPRVAALVAASMRGRMSQRLRGFGFRPPATEDDVL
ncbi:unnamed protein product [Ascophyllum nodosum]